MARSVHRIINKTTRPTELTAQNTLLNTLKYVRNYVIGNDIHHTSAFVDNSAVHDGGAMHISNTSITLEHVMLHNNTASSGGGIRFDGGNVAILENINFFMNTASQHHGGAMAIERWALTNRAAQLTIEEERWRILKSSLLQRAMQAVPATKCSFAVSRARNWLEFPCSEHYVGKKDRRTRYKICVCCTFRPCRVISCVMAHCLHRVISPPPLVSSSP